MHLAYAQLEYVIYVSPGIGLLLPFIMTNRIAAQYHIIPWPIFVHGLNF